MQAKFGNFMSNGISLHGVGPKLSAPVLYPRMEYGHFVHDP